MGAGVFHGRVRDGIGCRHPAIATRSSSPENGMADEVLVFSVAFPGFNRSVAGVVMCCRFVGRIIAWLFTVLGDVPGS